jgi:hypothetical protein
MINPEKVAYWFFRINGCTTIPNFVVHPDHGGPSQRTDVDVLAVRFPYRAELFTSGKPMRDHEVFLSTGKIDIVVAEVKHGMCRLNGPWTNPPNENLHRVLYTLGAFMHDHVPIVAESLYRQGQYCDDFYQVRLFAIGMTRNPEILLNGVQLIWDEILSFIYERLNDYRTQKVHHGQWDRTGKRLYFLAVNHERDEYIRTVKEYMQNHVDAGM